MIPFLSNLVFLNPWLLSALLALPALWYFLQIMPPAPRRIFLPSAAFLDGLVPEQQTSSKTPWWILLLRLVIAGLVILAFAKPVMNPSENLSGSSDLKIVLDNGWGSAHLWDRFQATADDLVTQAERSNASVKLLLTAALAGEKTPPVLGPFSAAEAKAYLNGLEPQAWPSDYSALAKTIESSNTEYDTYFLSNGASGLGFEDLFQALGPLKLFTPEAEDYPFLLTFPKTSSDGFDIQIVAHPELPEGLPLTLHALDENGRVIGLQNITYERSQKRYALDIPDILLPDIRRIQIAERETVSSTLIVDRNFTRKTVGLVSPEGDGSTKPFIEASFYLTRALEPFANLEAGTLETILSHSPAVIILPDVGAITPEHLNRLEDWVKGGGLLLRFAGPNMTQVQGQNFLVPVPLRSSERSLGGSMTWDEPPKLAPFSDSSPFYGLELREDVTIKQQLLPIPQDDIGQKTWASLEDGTPLITADRLDDGLLVMVHTTASPDWSDLPLSGVFVGILERLIKLAGTSVESVQSSSGTLQPIWILDAYGRIREPESTVQNIDASAFDDLKVSSQNPPGLYGRDSFLEALNLGKQYKTLKALPELPSGVTVQLYDENFERDLAPYFLYAALALLLLDWFIMLLLSLGFQWGFQWRKALPTAALLAFLIPSSPALAQSTYANGLYLAYIKSTSPTVNTLTERGLEGLSIALKRRTSAEPDGVVGLNPETDILSFFPFIYWPIATGDTTPSEAAMRNLQDYLDHGGTLLIDTRNPNGSMPQLQSIIGNLNIPPLAPIPDDHVLSKSFYLLKDYPGRYANGELWVETTSASGRDGVSSVIIGTHDWASAWAESQGRNYRAGARARQNEMALRFGVNVMMYALTGNYKADQVHVEHILERLGQ